VASAVDRIRDLFRWEMNAMEKNVARSEPGANGLTFLPYFDGERLPNLPNGCGMIHGLNSSNTNCHDIARALIEGIVVGLAQGMKRLVDLGIRADELRITGGGTKSATMRQIVSDIFGLPVMGFKVGEGAALGAAIQAAWTYGQTRGDPMPLEKIVKSAVKTDRKTRAEPRKENESLYAELRGRHADLAQKLASGGYL
jgi:xylulokinase